MGTSISQNTDKNIRTIKAETTSPAIKLWLTKCSPVSSFSRVCEPNSKPIIAALIRASKITIMVTKADPRTVHKTLNSDCLNEDEIKPTPRPTPTKKRVKKPVIPRAKRAHSNIPKKIKVDFLFKSSSKKLIIISSLNAHE